MAVENLLTDLRGYLVDEGIVRKPPIAGAEPPMWLEPKRGLPGPNEGEVAVEKGDPLVGAFLTGGVPARPFESSIRVSVVSLWIRGSDAKPTIALGGDLRDAIVDQRNFQLGPGGQTVIDCEEWTPLQRLGSDEQGFTYTLGLMFWTYA